MDCRIAFKNLGIKAKKRVVFSKSLSKISSWIKYLHKKWKKWKVKSLLFPFDSMKNTKYPSDISREQFEEIREILESAKKKTKPRKIELYSIFRAILYILKSGCQWRMLPKDFPDWKICHYYFTEWRSKTDKSGNSVLDRSLKKIGRENSIKPIQKP